MIPHICPPSYLNFRQELTPSDLMEYVEVSPLAVLFAPFSSRYLLSSQRLDVSPYSYQIDPLSYHNGQSSSSSISLLLVFSTKQSRGFRCFFFSIQQRSQRLFLTELIAHTNLDQLPPNIWVGIESSALWAPPKPIIFTKEVPTFIERFLDML
jgi:hypothetical protein